MGDIDFNEYRPKTIKSEKLDRRIFDLEAPFNILTSDMAYTKWSDGTSVEHTEIVNGSVFKGRVEDFCDTEDDAINCHCAALGEFLSKFEPGDYLIWRIRPDFMMHTAHFDEERFRVTGEHVYRETKPRYAIYSRLSVVSNEMGARGLV